MNEINTKMHSPAYIYFFKIINRNTRTMRLICSKLALKTPEGQHRPRSGIFI